MGSWNETCGLSNLPICPGEKVVFLLLTQNPYSDHIGRSGCYHGDFFFPRSIPLYGVYDDYGRVAIDDGQDASIEQIKQGFALDLIPQEADKYRHGPISMDTWTIDALQEWLHEGKVRIDKNTLNRLSDIEHAEMYKQLAAKEDALGVDDPGRAVTRRRGEEAMAARQLVSPSPIYKLIIRRDVWDAFTGIACNAWYGEYSLDRYKAGADSMIAKLSGKSPNASDLANLPDDLRRKYLRLDVMMTIDSDRENAFASRFVSAGQSGDPPYEIANRWYVRRMVEACLDGVLTAEDIRPIFYRLAELAQVEHVMAMTRRAWLPTVGMGSQSEENELCMEVYVKLARVAEAAVLKGIEERREWDEDEAVEAEDKFKALKKRLDF